MRRRVRALGITQLALIAEIDRVIVIRFFQFQYRIIMRAPGGSEFIVFGIDAVENIDEGRAHPIAQTAAVAYFQHTCELRLKIGGVPIEGVFSIENHGEVNLDYAD